MDILQKHFGIHGTHVADPVFLCGVEEYEKLIQNSHAEKKEPYVLSFLLAPRQPQAGSGAAHGGPL